jgi:beta-galactosidase/beta-glucuronidase
VHAGAANHLGKFLEIRRERFFIKGVRYAGPESGPSAFLPADLLTHLKALVRLGANTIRTCLPPPIEFLDEADRHRVIAGLPWPQHVAFPADRREMARVRADIRRQVDRLASHPALPLFAIGGPILPGVIRRHGSRTIARVLHDLCDEARAVDGSRRMMRLS